MSIRTTITLDEDVLDRTKEFSRERGIPFKEALNELVRSGLLAETSMKRKRAFRIKPRHMGVMPGLSYDNIGGLLDFGEGEQRR